MLKNCVGYFKNVVRQHNDLAPAAIEQQINNLIIHHVYGMIVHFKNVVRRRDVLIGPCGD